MHKISSAAMMLLSLRGFIRDLLLPVMFPSAGKAQPGWSPLSWTTCTTPSTQPHGYSFCICLKKIPQQIHHFLPLGGASKPAADSCCSLSASGSSLCVALCALQWPPPLCYIMSLINCCLSHLSRFSCHVFIHLISFRVMIPP